MSQAFGISLLAIDRSPAHALETRKNLADLPGRKVLIRQSCYLFEYMLGKPLLLDSRRPEPIGLVSEIHDDMTQKTHRT
jgi:hypothetical protein